MKWDRVTYDDGEGYWLECKFPPLGELCIDNLRGEWQLFWFNGNGETTISRHATEADARQAGAQFVAKMEAVFIGKRAQGFEQQDDGN